MLAKFTQPEKLLGPLICSLCERNISKSVKVECAECGAPGTETPQVFLCLECLRTGKTSKEFPAHEASHDYFIYDNLDFPLLTEDWTAHQEIRLIQGIMKCGLGNWLDISEQFVKGGKSPKDCEQHYYAVLMRQQDSIEYSSALVSREHRAEDCQLDPAKLDLVHAQIDEYLQMKAQE